MKFTRPAKLAAVAIVGTLALAACSSSSSSGGDGGSTGGIAGAACQTGTISGAGSSAQGNAMAAWATGYQTACPSATINYDPSKGSGGGVKQFIANQVAFAGSDSPIKDDPATGTTDLTDASKRCATGAAINIPMVGGAIAIAFNLSGVEKLVLDPTTIAGIFSSKITQWNDPAIAKLNPGVTLPSAPIVQFHRSASSGTTDNFTKYLLATAPTGWPYKGGKDWHAPGGQGKTDSSILSKAIKDTPNSIGYVELSFAQSGKLSTAWVDNSTTDNGAGAVEATSANAAKTIEAATVTGTPNNLPLKIDYKVASPAYPLVLVTYEIVCQAGNDAATLGLLKGFLTYTASDDGQNQLSTSGYVPITGQLLTQVRTAVGSLS